MKTTALIYCSVTFILSSRGRLEGQRSCQGAKQPVSGGLALTSSSKMKRCSSIWTKKRSTHVMTLYDCHIYSFSLSFFLSLPFAKGAFISAIDVLCRNYKVACISNITLVCQRWFKNERIASIKHFWPWLIEKLNLYLATCAKTIVKDSALYLMTAAVQPFLHIWGGYIFAVHSLDHLQAAPLSYKLHS